MTTATITFPDASTAMLVDEKPPETYVSLFALLRAVDPVTSGPILAAALASRLSGLTLCEQNTAAKERLLQLDPMTLVEFRWDQ